MTVQFSRGELTSAGKNEQTPVLNVKKTGSIPDFATYNINFVNTYPQTPNTAALAADYYGTNFAAYGCSFIGFQDTLLANKGVQVFANSYVEGSIDFIWYSPYDKYTSTTKDRSLTYTQGILDRILLPFRH